MTPFLEGIVADLQDGAVVDAIAEDVLWPAHAALRRPEPRPPANMPANARGGRRRAVGNGI
eukprot:4204155-Alexandrium_andersonii.AAC.1